MNRKRRLAAATFLYAALLFPTEACQETCVIFDGDKEFGRLENYDGSPIRKAKLTIRVASKNAKGPAVKPLGYRRGPVVKTVRTDSTGSFRIPRLQPGEYWITYRHETEGESFLVQVSGASNRGQLTLTINSWPGNACDVVDVERNALKPPDWGDGRALVASKKHRESEAKPKGT
jgi:hypothetical protein